MDFSEVFKIAFFAIRSNKLRSILTLLGIVVGVFSIIAVMTAVQVLQSSIENGLSNLGTHTFQIQKMPVMAGHDAWMKAQKRKDIRYEQAARLKDKITLAASAAIDRKSVV